MARKTRAEEPPLELKVFATPDEIDRGIAKLRRRITQVQDLLSKGVRYNAAEVSTATSDVRRSVLEIFGPNSPEYREHQFFDVMRWPVITMGDTGEDDFQRSFEQNVPKSVGILNGLVARLEEAKLELQPGGPLEAFFPKGSQHDAYVEIRGIVRQAQSSVTIVDPYMDGSIFALLGGLDPKPMKLELLTFIAKAPPDFKLEAKKFQTQRTWATLEIRTHGDFHDRFVLLDGKRCFHIGASIKDAGNKAFMISELEDPANNSALLKAVMASWMAGTPVPM